jgi:beta-N-acetylhexosaminidase
MIAGLARSGVYLHIEFRDKSLAMYRQRIIAVISIILLTAPYRTALSHGQQQGTSDPQVEAIFQGMSAEEKVGQLFVVTFVGNDWQADSDIADLITEYHVGGVILSVSEDNFTDADEMSVQVQQLATGLQTIAAGADEAPPSPTTPLVEQGPYIPIFVGIELNGSRGVVSAVDTGFSPIASSMAIGATWEPLYARETGHLVGHELADRGVNLLIGPYADVVEEPQISTTGDLGTREFGGESYWVAQMTSNYVQGIHEGSGGRMAVFPRYFPGHGLADRVASIEIPTIRRTRDQLIQSDLKPFFAVTGDALDPLAQAEGLLTGHIKFRGLQGVNPRFDTRPISLDQQNLQALLSEPALASWRLEGGLMMTDALGVQGISTLYDPQNTNMDFRYRSIAKDALLAGNDVLYLGGFDAAARQSQTIIVTDTLQYFAQQYRENPAFMVRVDDAVRRILKTKLDLYDGSFDTASVLAPSGGPDDVAGSTDITFRVAQSALTLLSPSQVDLLNPPQRDDLIVIFTDTRTALLCSTCTPQPIVSQDALQAAILRQYGPQATGEVSLANLRSFSFDQLATYLSGEQPAPDSDGTPQPNEVGIALATADWVVFVMQDVRPDVPSSQAVRTFLANPPVDIGTELVALSLGAPYYLDVTEVGKLTAYYGLYGTSRPFIDVAAQALFLDIPADGASPVSVPAVDYSIFDATLPDAAQIISLTFELQRLGTPQVGTPVPQQGDRVVLRTGVIVDENGNPVPDGTQVEFVFNYMPEGLRDTALVGTIHGIAEASLILDRPGNVAISVNSLPATASIEIELPLGEEPTVRTPLPLPTGTPVATETPVTEVPLQHELPTPLAPEFHGNRRALVGFGDLYLSLFGLVLMSVVVFGYTYRSRDLNYSLLLALPIILGGLISYNYYALVLPGTLIWHSLIGDQWGAALSAWVGGTTGLAIMLALRNRGMPFNRRGLRRG